MMAMAPSRKDRRTVADVAIRFGVSRKTIRNLLSEFRRQFDPPIYGRTSGHPRKLRLLTPRDVTTLDRLVSASLSSRLSRLS
jgi:hypothetical protein